MTEERLIQLLDFLGLPWKKDGSGQEIIFQCLKCGKDWHFYANIRAGVAKCFRCDYAVPRYTEMSLLTAVAVRASEEPGPQDDLYEARGLKSKAPRLGYWDPLGRYTIPYWFKDDEVKTISFRASGEGQSPKYLRPPGIPSLPYVRNSESPATSTVLTEGELDACLFSEHVDEVRVIGMPGAGVFPTGLSDYLVGPVVIAFDGDDVGRAGAQKLKDNLEKIGHRALLAPVIPGPYKDLTELYLGDPVAWLKWLQDLHQDAMTLPQVMSPVFQKGFRGLAVTDYLRNIPPEEKWLVQDIWNDRAMGFIAGFPKAMKSLLLLSMSTAVSVGGPFLGHRTSGPSTVLLFQEEDADFIIRERLARLWKGRAGALHVFTPYTMGESLNLSSSLSVQRLRDTIDLHRPSLLALDPFANMASLEDENSASAVNKVLEELRKIRNDFGTAVAIVHHLRKAQDSSWGQRMRGSSVLHAKSECAIYVSRDGSVVTLHLESKTRPDHTLIARYTASGDFVPVSFQEDDSLKDRVVELLKASPTTNTRLLRALGDGASLASVQDTLQSLREEGIVYSVQQEDGTYWYIS